jgi:hypothetical protein
MGSDAKGDVAMKWIAAAILAGVFILFGCKDPADSPECKEWQTKYMQAARTPGLSTSDLLKQRPEGCPIP